MSFMSKPSTGARTYRHNPYAAGVTQRTAFDLSASVTVSVRTSKTASVAGSRRMSAKVLSDSPMAVPSEGSNYASYLEECSELSDTTCSLPYEHTPTAVMLTGALCPVDPVHTFQLPPVSGATMTAPRETFARATRPLPVAPVSYPQTSGTVCVGLTASQPLRFLPPPPPSRKLLLDGIIKFETFCNMLLRWYNKVIATEKFYWLRVNALAPRAEEYSCNIHEWAMLVSEWWWTYVNTPRMVSFEDLQGATQHVPMPLRKTLHPASTSVALNASVEVGKLTGKRV